MSNPPKSGAGSSRMFRIANKNKGLEMQTLPEAPPDDEQFEPASAGSFHKQIAASIMQHHQCVDRARRSLQPVSPASYCSSTELTPHNPAATPTSSLDYRGRMGKSSNFSLKTSTELLKVLNRIWCLEEQHASYASLVRGLKMELNNARMRIRELVREKQVNHQVIDDLMNQVSEQDLVGSSLESVREELEEERKLRKRSESLHHKLAREISEVKFSFSNAMNELERERRARVLLEDLCDEFAMVIREYEQELRSLKLKSHKAQVQKDGLDSLVLHISEAWLDERMQMKLAQETQKNVGEKNIIVDKLRPEIETFLKAKQTSDSKENFDMPEKNSITGAFVLNEATCAPQNADDEDDNESIDSDMYCFELKENISGEFSNGIHRENVDDTNKRSLEDYKGKLDVVNKKGETKEVRSGGSLSILQARLEQHTAKTPNPGLLEVNHMLDNVVRTNSSSIQGERIHPESELAHELFAVPASAAKKGEPKIISKDRGNPVYSSIWPRSSNESTLKAKLLEARLEGRNSISRGS